ncbi:unnamed protein product [Danaus chrysippus]|uniref:(African queen) hypothetical protein n=1 Tax=Danaus chrysippus TaxID=151541 RepID=A0A8J2QLL9_9NEOP|nr:unnamed protein product [Danaus chrysippus]
MQNKISGASCRRVDVGPCLMFAPRVTHQSCHDRAGERTAYPVTFHKQKFKFGTAEGFYLNIRRAGVIA